MLAVVALLAIAVTCAEIQEAADNSTCLPDGIPYASRQLLVQNGIELPLGFWVHDWASARLSTEIAKILVREVLGIHAITSGLGDLSTFGLYATAGCREPTLFADDRRACSIESHADTQHHATLEVWGVATLVEMERVLAAIPSIIPENAGSMGYAGFQGLYVFEDDRVAAYEAAGLALDYYRSWNVSWHEPWLFLDTMSNVDGSLLLPCEENPQLQDAAAMTNYLLWTGDEDGIVRDDDGNVVRGQCWNNSWWVPPACRANFNHCVPSITAGGAWGFVQSIQQTFAHNMPIAIAVAVDTQTWGKLGKSVRGAHYYFTPDTTFIQEVPIRIRLPEYSKDKAREGRLDMDDAASPLTKFLWSGMADMSPTAHSLLQKYAITKEDMDSMLYDADTNPDSTDEEVACRWLHENPARWMPWVPDPRYCKAGAGIVDEVGNFVNSIEHAARCEYCPAGWHGSAQNLDNTRTCIECPVGTSQALPAQTTCISCNHGYFAGQPGQPRCEACGEGSFQSETGASECRQCPGGSTTRLLGAASSEECICPRDTYQPFLERGRSGEEMECKTCPEGMSCGIDSREQWLLMESNLSATNRVVTGNYPTVLEGYMTLKSEPLKVFRCVMKGVCPGGQPGTCSSRRDSTSVACGECHADTYEDISRNCKTCNNQQVAALLMLASILIPVALALLSWAANREKITERNSAATCAIIAGITCSSIQTLSVLSSLEVEWLEPLKSALSAMLLSGFDVRMITIGCLVDNVVGMFVLRQLFAPGLACTLLIMAVLQKRTVSPSVNVRVHVCNSAGSLFLLFYTAMVLSAVMPLVCYTHPNANGESMVSHPAILCFDQEKHTVMMAIGLVALCTICIPFFALVLLATALYPRRIATGSSMHLRQTLFLFRRFRPGAFYYSTVLLSRSVILCMVPVMFQDKVGAQILVISMTLSVFIFLQGRLWPWRGIIGNVLELSILLTLNLLVTCAACFTNAPHAKESVSVIGHLAIFFTVFGIMISFAISFMTRVVPKPFYEFFVSHHKADAAAQARLLQLLLQRTSQQSCFLDSDHLTNLDELFDVVRSRVGRMVVYLTRDVLTRPWCVGEIITAHKANVCTTRVVTPSFADSDPRCYPPVPLERKPAILLPRPDCLLDDFTEETVGPEFLQAGIYPQFVQPALHWVLSSDVQEVVMNEALLGLGTMRFGAVAGLIASKESSKMNYSMRRIATGTLSDPPEDVGLVGAILMSCNVDDEEAVACAGILAFLLQDWATSKTGQGICPLCDLQELELAEARSFAGTSTLMASAAATIVFFTQGSLTSMLQLNQVLAAVDLANRGIHSDMVSVSTEKFRFPDETYYVMTLPQVLDSDLDHGDATNMLQQLFRRICIQLTPHASDLILQTEADRVKSRLLLEHRNSWYLGVVCTGPSQATLSLCGSTPRNSMQFGSTPRNSMQFGSTPRNSMEAGSTSRNCSRSCGTPRNSFQCSSYSHDATATATSRGVQSGSLKL